MNLWNLCNGLMEQKWDHVCRAIDVRSLWSLFVVLYVCVGFGFLNHSFTMHPRLIELSVLLIQLPKSWACRHAAPSLTYTGFWQQHCCCSKTDSLSSQPEKMEPALTSYLSLHVLCLNSLLFSNVLFSSWKL